MPPNFNSVVKDDYTIIRFNSLYDLFYYDIRKNNPRGLGYTEDYKDNESYLENRWKLDDRKKQILDKAYNNLNKDESFLKLMHKQKTLKRQLVSNKYGGNFNPVAYSRQEDKMFIKNITGKKKGSINIAIQVGVFQGKDYETSFVEILKLILSLQQLNIPYNIDMFDSDTKAIAYKDSFVIVNVSNTLEKFDLKSILCCSHEQFFWFSLFNGYSALNNQGRIETFLSETKINRLLSPYYDIIAGNISDTGYSEMMLKVNKIIHDDNKN
jgi:hypothetical protein